MEPFLVDAVRLSVNAEQGGTGGYELTERGNELQPDPDPSGFVDEVVVADRGDDARTSSAHDSWTAVVEFHGGALIGVLAIEQFSGVLADEFDQRGDAQ